LPALAGLPGPLTLIEVGASAGLTLLFDRYSYDYDGARLSGSDPDAPMLRCSRLGHVPAPIPERMPEIAWRAGLDLNPLDVTSEEDVLWLSCLVWPGEGNRRERLDAAVMSARRDPPGVYRVTFSPTFRKWRRRHRGKQRSLSITRPCSHTSPLRIGGGSPRQSGRWARSGYRMSHPAS
jgi:hypothetical protein